MKNELNKTARDEFLDNYFATRLQQLIALMKDPELENRDDHLSEVYDTLMRIAEEYQSVMLDKEEGYWLSLEMWNDECNQTEALALVNRIIDG